jgi:CPA2 family monovalent cation:H+ antiporter-2
MDIWLLIMEITALLGLAFVLGAVAQRLKQSAIVGYLLAGAVLGPLLFNRSAVQGVAELGVALLLFSIGLEFSFSRLRRMGARAFVVGVLQILLTLAVFAALFAGHGPFPQALALGAIIALSSTAIVLRVLMDRMEIDAIHGRNALAILLTHDAAVVPLVLLVTIMGHGGDLHSVSLHIARTLASAGGLAAVFYLLFYMVIPRTLMTRGLFNNRELVVLLTIAIGAGSAWAAHAIGLSPALGAFIAGMLLAESPFATQIRSDIVSLRTLFVTLFFTSIGMLADPQWFLANWVQALLWLSIVFALKTLIVAIVGALMRIPFPAALATGITLAQIGEFSFWKNRITAKPNRMPSV